MDERGDLCPSADNSTYVTSQIAQVYAQDNLDVAKARDSYVRAGEWYKQEEANA